MGTDRVLVYSKPFFELQLAFARKIADLLQQPLDQAVLQRTAFYRIFGLDWSLDPTNPIWQSYSEGLQRAVDDVDYTYQHYLQRYDSIPKFVDEEHWGCFAYDYNPQTHNIKIHFGNADTSPYGPLSHQRVDTRKGELKAMFTVIQQRHPDADLERVGRRGGLFVKRTGDFYGFFHRTFEEYFAALHILKRIESERDTEIKAFIALVRQRDDLWREPYLLAVALKSREDSTVATQLIRELFQTPQNAKDPLHDLLLATTAIIESETEANDRTSQQEIAAKLIQTYEQAQRGKRF